MYRKHLFIIGLILFLWTGLDAEMITEEGEYLFVRNQHYFLIISKKSGMLEDAQLRDSPFQIASDYPGFSLFFTEFGLQLPDTTGEIFSNSALKTFGGTVTYSQLETSDFARLEFIWDNPYIRTTWNYNFFPDKKYFVVNLEREVKTTAVYANHQQCIMTNPDFDNSYLVNYEGDWFQVMARGNVGPGAMERSASFQHSMYTAIDNGAGIRFPALGWYQSQLDVTFGVIIPTVSANQRVSIAYHGGGRTPLPRHPGYSECQIDWFGKADSESVLLLEGTRYSMKLYYYLTLGSVDSLDNFNQQLFHSQQYDLLPCEDYSVAGWGGRRAYLRRYTWTYPQASTNYINSQELFEHRAISIPRSQNGSPWPHLFEIMLTHENELGELIDLTPVPRINGELKVHDRVSNDQGADWHSGEVVWLVDSLETRLQYKVFNESDKLTVSGSVVPSELTRVKKLYVNIPFSARIHYVKKLTDYSWDIRATDTILGEIGISIYDLAGILEVEKDPFGLRLILNREPDSFTPDKSWQFEFKLYPHIEQRVEYATDITPFFSKPAQFYREYYLSFPEIIDRENWGVRPDNRFSIIHSHLQLENNIFFSVQLFAEDGNYPICFYCNQQTIQGITVNGKLLANDYWRYDLNTGVLWIEHDWAGLTTVNLLKSTPSNIITSENKNWNENSNFRVLRNFPNPMNSSSQITLQVFKNQSCSIEIVNILGQRVISLSQDVLAPGRHTFTWHGKNDRQQAVPSGIYFLCVESGRFFKKQKILLIR